MFTNLKNGIAQQLTSLPIVSTLFYKYYVYRTALDEKLLRGKIQYLGHCIDLHITTGSKVPMPVIRELQFLLRETFKKQLPLDGPMLWSIELLLRAKYGLRPVINKASTGPVCGGADTKAHLIDVIMNRRSVRKWTSEPTDLDDIEKAIEVARWAPSSCNKQPWQTLIIAKKEDIEFISEYFPGNFYTRAPVLLLIVMNKSLYGFSEKHFAYLDGGAFIQNLLLTLHANGYGACWLGFKGWDSADNLFVESEKYHDFYEHFKLNKNQVPISMVALGRPAMQPKAPPRQDLSNIIIRDL